jgi:hypothetical protein
MIWCQLVLAEHGNTLNLLNSVKRPHCLIEGIQRLLYIAHMSEEASQRFEDMEVPHNLNSPDDRRPFLEEMDEYLLSQSVFSDVLEQIIHDSDRVKISPSHDIWIQQFLTECVNSFDPHEKNHLIEIEAFRSKLGVGKKVFKDFKFLLALKVEDGGLSAPTCVNALLETLRFAELWDVKPIANYPNGVSTLIKAMTFLQSQGILTPSDSKLTSQSIRKDSLSSQTLEDLVFSYKCESSMIQIAGASTGKVIRTNEPLSDGVRKDIIQVLDSFELTFTAVHSFGPPEQEILLSFNEALIKKPSPLVIPKRTDTIRLKQIIHRLGISLELVELIIDHLGIHPTQAGIKGAITNDEFNRIQSTVQNLGIHRTSEAKNAKDEVKMATAKIKVSELAKSLGMSNAELLQLCQENNVAAKKPESTIVEAFVPMLKRKAEAAGLVRSLDIPDSSRPKSNGLKVSDLGLLLGLTNAEMLNLCEDCKIKAPTPQSRIPTSFIPILRRQLSISKPAPTRSRVATRVSVPPSIDSNELVASKQDFVESNLVSPEVPRLRISKLAKELQHTSAEIKIVCDQQKIEYTKMGLILETDLPKLKDALSKWDHGNTTSSPIIERAETEPEHQELIIRNEFNDQDCNQMDFSEAELCDSKFLDSSFIQAIFAGADLTGSDISNCDFRRIEGFLSNFSECTITDSSFDYSDLESAVFTNSKLVNVTFKDCNLLGADFEGAELINTEINLNTSN